MDSEIGGVNTTVAQIQAQLGRMQSGTSTRQTVRRPEPDGTVTLVTLTVGDRALQGAPRVMSFYRYSMRSCSSGCSHTNGFQTIKPGAAVKLVFDNRPGRIYHGKIVEIPHGVGQGQVEVLGHAGALGLDQRRQDLSGDEFRSG